MTRKLLLFLCLFLLAPSLMAGCSKESAAPSESLFTGSVSDIYTAMEKSGYLPQMLSLTPDLILDETGIDTSACSECEFHISLDGLLADEVVLLRASDENSAKEMLTALSDHLESRKQQFMNYLPEQYSIMQKAILRSSGTDIFLIVSSHANELAAFIGN